MSELKTGALTIQRADLLSSLRAIHATQARFGTMLKEGEYSAGYREGFEDALAAVALAVGVELEKRENVISI